MDSCNPDCNQHGAHPVLRDYSLFKRCEKRSGSSAARRVTFINNAGPEGYDMQSGFRIQRQKAVAASGKAGAKWERFFSAGLQCKHVSPGLSIPVRKTEFVMMIAPRNQIKRRLYGPFAPPVVCIPAYGALVPLPVDDKSDWTYKRARHAFGIRRIFLQQDVSSRLSASAGHGTSGARRGTSPNIRVRADGAHQELRPPARGQVRGSSESRSLASYSSGPVNTPFIRTAALYCKNTVLRE